MLKKWWGLALAALVFLSLGPAQARAQALDISFFYDALAPYGEWLTLSPYGDVWCPYDQTPGWRPYMDGDWIYSDYGWTYDSSQPWGWAAYHYGRWTMDPECGWVWVPGYTWGPAWVAWRFGDGYCGWAPLPPGVGFSFGLGLELGGFDLNLIPWNEWCFTGVDWLGRRGMRDHIFSEDRNIGFLRQTRNVTDYGFQGDRVINRGIAPREIEQLTHRTITQYQLGNQGPTGNHVSRLQGNTLEMFRPNFSQNRKPGVTPRNVIPKRLQIPQQELARRHSLENQTLTRQYQNNLNAMQRRHQQELQSLPRGMSRQEMMNRQQKEMQAFQQYHQNQMRFMNNRHQREMGMNQRFHGGGGHHKES
jgi:hypothetical protein